MTLDTEKFPKHVEDFQSHLWKDEGEWRKIMTLLYRGETIQ